MDRVEYEEDLIEIDLQEYIRLLWYRKWIIIGLVIIALAASYFISQQMTRIYQTSVMIMVEEQSGAEDFFSDKLTLIGSQDNKIATYSEMLKSRKILKRVIRELDLRDEKSGEYISPLALRNNITVSVAGETDLINVTATYPDPVMAARIVNTLISVFKEDNLELKKADLTGAANFINEQLKNVKSQLADLEKKILNYKESNDIYYPEQQGKDMLKKLTELETGKIEAELKLKQARASLNEMKKHLDNEDREIITTKTFSKNPVVQNSKKRLAELQLELSGLLEIYTEKHPKVVETRAKINEVKQSLNSTVGEIISSRTESINPMYQPLQEKIINNQIQLITSQIHVDNYNRQINEINQELKGLPAKELELARLQRESKVTENIYLMLSENREEINIQQAMRSSDIVVVDPAIIVEDPVKPNVKLNMAIAAFLALFVGIGIIFLMEYLDNTVKVEEDVEKLTGLPVLGVIPEIDSENTNKDESN